jgi:hypothetical protein
MISFVVKQKYMFISVFSLERIDKAVHPKLKEIVKHLLIICMIIRWNRVIVFLKNRECKMKNFMSKNSHVATIGLPVSE